MITRPAHSLLIVLMLASPVTYAAVVEITLSSKVTVAAEYRLGDANKPALMLVHGFLQTRESPTVQRLTQSLAEEGYTVLAPTLSLGVPKRKQSLPCEAIHNHSYEGDVAELATWADWLRQNQHKNIILIGHSFGSLQSLSFAASNSNPAVRAVISVSLVDMTDAPGTVPRASVVRDARNRVKKGDTASFSPAFSFCKTFPTTPANYLSYAQWDRKTILALLKRVKLSNHIIIGGKDQRMGADWPAKLRGHGASVGVVEGANHFFDDQYEFDLLEAVVARLRQLHEY